MTIRIKVENMDGPEGKTAYGQQGRKEEVLLAPGTSQEFFVSQGDEVLIGEDTLSSRSYWGEATVENGIFKIENENALIQVFADFSGTLTEKSSGNSLPFTDLRIFIEAGDYLKEALRKNYGGYR